MKKTTQMKTLAEQIAAEGSEANWDEKITSQQREIEEEVASTQALITDKLPIDCIEQEYKKTNNNVFATKAKELAGRYQWIRKIRGDGNCFYRAVAFAQCERIRDNPAEYEKYMAIARGWKDRLIKLGFPKMTTEDFCDVFVDTMERIKDNKDGADFLQTFRDQGISDYIVVFMRLVTSGYLLENEGTFSGFVEGNRTMKEYCAQEVEPMAKECEHICITALTSALEVPLRIEYMDQTLAPSTGWHHDFLPDGLKVPSIFFLYRPGHYDVLYPK